MRTLEQFILDPTPLKREWIDVPGFHCMYVRLGRRGICIDGRSVMIDNVLQLASFQVEEPGQGIFTRFINRLMKESKHPIYIENVLDERFSNYLERMGFKKVDNFGVSPSFFMTVERTI